MPIYECDYCNYSTIIKTHYNKHLKTQKHLKNIKKLDAKLLEKFSTPKNEHKMATNIDNLTLNEDKMTPNTNKDCEKTAKDCEKTEKDCEKTAKDCEKTAKDCEKTEKDCEKTAKNNKIQCKYCSKTFTRQNNLNVHLKNSCKKYKEDQRIIEIENKYKIELEIQKKQQEFYKGEIDNLHKRIEELIDKNRTTIINIDKQINLNSYGSEDMSHVTDNFKNQMLKIPFVAIPKMIEEVHFSDKKPENKNIKLTNKKENYVKVYQNDKWIFKDRKATIKQLMNDKYTIIDNHYEESIEDSKPKHVVNQFKKFKEMYSEGDKGLHNEIMVDCELLLLNNREN